MKKNSNQNSLLAALPVMLLLLFVLSTTLFSQGRLTNNAQITGNALQSQLGNTE
jgi:hypothetical protein